MFYGILAALAAVIVGLDQWTKWLTVTHIPSTNGSAVVKAIPGFFHITHIKNTGAAWSMLEGQTWLFVLVTAAFFAIVGVLIWKKVLQKKFELVCLAMIAGGDLMYNADNFVSTYGYLQGYIMACVLYFIICFPLAILVQWLEKRSKERPRAKDIPGITDAADLAKEA